MKTFVFIFIFTVARCCFRDMICLECISSNCAFIVTSNGSICEYHSRVLKPVLFKVVQKSQCHEADLMTVKRSFGEVQPSKNAVITESFSVAIPTVDTSSGGYVSSSKANTSHDLTSYVTENPIKISSFNATWSIDGNASYNLEALQSSLSNETVCIEDLADTFTIPNTPVAPTPVNEVENEKFLIEKEEQSFTTDASRSILLPNSVKSTPAPLAYESYTYVSTPSYAKKITTELVIVYAKDRMDGDMLTSLDAMNELTRLTSRESSVSLDEQTLPEILLKQRSSRRSNLRGLFEYNRKRGVKVFNCARADVYMIEFERSLCRLVLTSRRIKLHRVLDPELKQWLHGNPGVKMNEMCAFVRAERDYCKKFTTMSNIASSTPMLKNFNLIVLMLAFLCIQ